VEAYDPRTDPDAAGWLAMEESDRIQAVLAYHKRARIRVPSERLHATIHVIVENQLALEVPEVLDTLARLQREGLNRHEAVHAIGSVLAGHIYELLKQGPAEEVVSNAAYFEGLKKLTAAGWCGAG
jgi:hypothetical protein